MRLFIGLMLISFNLFAGVVWNDLEENRTYTIKQSFQLPILVERSRAFLNVIKGEKLKLLQTTSLDMINVTLYTFKYGGCPGQALKTDMEIIPVTNTSPLVEVGFQLTYGCRMEVFIENKDLLSKSLFE